MNATIHEIAPDEIMAYREGELSADRAQQISAHLDTCEECRNLAEEFHTTSKSLASWKINAVPPSLQSSVLSSFPRFVPGDSNGSFFPWQLLRSHRGLLTLGLLVSTISFVFFEIQNARKPDIAMLRDATRVDMSSYVPSRRTDVAGGGGGGGDRTTIIDDQATTEFASRDVIKQRLEQDRLSSSLENDNRQTVFDKLAPAPPPPPIAAPRAQEQTVVVATEQAPMIARTAELQIVVAKFDAARGTLESVVTRHHGYAASLNVGDAENTARTLNASLRIPSQELLAALGELKTMGHVTSESQAGEEVTAEHADLVARLKNSRETEARLRDILRTRTGKVRDVLEVEQEMARVRGEIEQMESERKTLEHRVDFATITLAISEEYKAKVTGSTPGVTTRFHNAAVAGYEQEEELRR